MKLEKTEKDNTITIRIHEGMNNSDMLDLKRYLSNRDDDNRHITMDCRAIEPLPLGFMQLIVTFLGRRKQKNKGFVVLYAKSESEQISLWGLDRLGWENIFREQ
jgi:hypothetical protein